MPGFLDGHSFRRGRAARLGLVVFLAAAGLFVLARVPGPGPVAPDEPRAADREVAPHGLDSSEPGAIASAPELPGAARRAPPATAPPEGALEVRVRSSRGPVGDVPVTIYVRYLDWPEAPLERFRRRTEGADAGVVYADFARSLREVRERDDAPWSGRGAELGFAVGIELPGVPADERVAVSASDGPGRLVELFLDDDLACWLRPLEVRAVDARGRPVGDVEVVLGARRELDGDSLDELATRTSRAEDGIAVFDRALQLEALRRFEAFGARALFEARARIAAFPEPRVDLETADRGEEPVELRLPPTGRVRVEVRESGGGRTAREGAVTFFWRPLASGSTWQRVTDHVVAWESGACELGPLGLGLELRLLARTDDGRASSETLTLAGPGSAGEVVGATLQLGDDLPWLVATLVDRDGAPLANRTVRYTVRPEPPPPPSPGSGPAWGRTETDGGGRVRILYEGPLRADGPRALAFRLTGEEPEPSGAVLLPSAIPAASASGGELELGPVVVELPPGVPREPVLICSGRVLDDVRAPVAGAEVWLRVADGVGEDAILGPVEHVTDCDDAGRFTIRGPHPLGPFRLFASREGHRSGSVDDVQVGATGVTISIERAGAIAGEVLLDAGIPSDRVYIALESGGVRRELSLAEIGTSFRIDRLRPGEARVELAIDTTRWTLERLEGVGVVAGETRRDARLDPLDLRGRIRVVQLALEREDASPLGSTYVELRDERGRGGRLETDREGRLGFLAPASMSVVTIAVEGCADVSIDPASPPARVRLVSR